MKTLAGLRPETQFWRVRTRPNEPILWVGIVGGRGHGPFVEPEQDLVPGRRERASVPVFKRKSHRKGNCRPIVDGAPGELGPSQSAIGTRAALQDWGEVDQGRAEGRGGVVGDGADPVVAT